MSIINWELHHKIQIQKMNSLDKQYTDLLKTILEHGVEKKDRTGVGTKSIFGYTIRHDMKQGFPAITTKKLAFKTMVTELLWFLRGDTNIKFLVENNCNIWNGDAYKNYEKWYDNMAKTTPFEVPRKFTEDEFVKSIKLDDGYAEKFGELGPIYGKQWRNWVRKTTREEKIVEPGIYEMNIDQIQNLINDLKTTPDSRRLMVNAWNVGEIDNMVLPPCHYGFQVYTRELSDKERIEWMGGKIQEKYPALVEQQIKHCDEHNVPKRAISLMWNQRSVDTFLGLPFNIASYSLLLTIIGKIVNMVPDQLVGNLGDTHLYLNHLEEAKEQIKNEPFPLPKLEIHKTDEFWKGFDVSQFNHLDINDFELHSYLSHKSIKAKLNN
jgi:thymidylate synthase